MSRLFGLDGSWTEFFRKAVVLHSTEVEQGAVSFCGEGIYPRWVA